MASNKEKERDLDVDFMFNDDVEEQDIEAVKMESESSSENGSDSDDDNDGHHREYPQSFTSQQWPQSYKYNLLHHFFYLLFLCLNFLLFVFVISTHPFWVLGIFFNFFSLLVDLLCFFIKWSHPF